METPFHNNEFDPESYYNYFQHPQIPVPVDLKLKIFHYNHAHQGKNDIPYDRIFFALSIMQFYDHVFAQFWACVNFRSTSVFSTRGQPFGLSKCTNEYSSYRIACLDHNSYVHPSQKVCIGLPAHVFLNKSPIWIQDVCNYNDKMYPQQQDARHSNIQGSIFVPLLEGEGDRFYGVLELAMSNFMNTCSYEMSEVCRAFKEAGFKSWDQNEIMNRDTFEDYTPRIESGNTTKECCDSRSRNITFNDVTKLFGLPKAVAATRCGVSPNTFTSVHKRHGIVEWPCTRSGVVSSIAHTALVYGRDFEISYDVARAIEGINSWVMQDNDGKIVEDCLLYSYMKALDSIVGKRVREPADEGTNSDLLVLYHHNNKRLRN